MERIKLRDFQKEISKKILEIFNRDNFNRFAAVIVPTGGGKTYNEVDIISTFEEDLKSKKCYSENISSKSILSVSPKEIINNRKKALILKTFVLNLPDEALESADTIYEFMRDNYGKDNKKYYGVKKKELRELIKEGSTREEKINAIYQCLDNKERNYLLKRAFPNLKFACYAGLDKIAADKKTKYDLIIFDESHRTQAKTWLNRIKKIVNINNPDAKIIALTATPEREDSLDGIKDLARTIYGKDIPEKEYLVKDIRLKQAMERGIVIAPESIHSNSGLVDRYLEVIDEYLEFIFQTPEASINKSEKKAIENYEKTIRKMSKIIFHTEENNILDEFSKRIEQYKEDIQGPYYFNDGEKLKKDIHSRVEEKRKELISDTLKDSITKKNAKCIIFVPSYDSKKFSSYEEYIEYTENYIKEIYGKIAEKLGSKLNIKRISSSLSDAENDANINEFENSTSEDTIQILYSVQMFDEGMHIEGIDHCIHLSVTYSANQKNQRDGRVISSPDPNLSFEEQPKRSVIDCVGNNIIQHERGEKRSVSYDLECAEDLKKWIEKNNRIPNINSEDDNEARYAFLFKTLQSIYKSYRNNDISGVDEIEKEYISELISVCDQILDGKFWDYKMPKRTIEPSEEKLTGKNFYELTEDEKEFLKLYNDFVNNRPKGIKSLRKWDIKTFDILMTILQEIVDRKKDVVFPANITIPLSNCKGYKNTDFNNVTDLTSFLRKLEFSDQDIQEMLEKIAVETEISDVGKLDVLDLLANYRGIVWSTAGNYREKFFYNESGLLRYPMEDLVNCGIFGYKRVNKEEYFEAFRKATTTDKKANFFDICLEPNDDEHISRDQAYKENGRIESKNINLLREFKHANLKTGLLYRINGLDWLGFDKYGFSHRNNNFKYLGKTKYNKRGFYLREGKYINKITGTEYDAFGYNIENKNKDGELRPISSHTFKKVKVKTKDGEKELWIHEDTSDIFDLEGYDYYKFDKNGNYKYTSGKTNRRMFYRSETGEYLNKLTRTKYDALGYDIDDKGIDEDGNEKIRPKPQDRFVKVDVKTQKDGKIVTIQRWIHEKTSSLYDSKGYDYFLFNRHGINKITKTEYNKRGFYLKEGKYINKITGTEYDAFGYNIEDRNEDGELRPESTHTFKKVIVKSEDGEKELWIHEDTSDLYDDYGFNVEGFNRNTYSFQNKRGFILKDGKYINIITKTEYDAFGFDINDRDEKGNVRPKPENPEKVINYNGHFIFETTSQEFDLQGNVYNNTRNSDSIGYKTRKGTAKEMAKNGMEKAHHYSIKLVKTFINQYLRTETSDMDGLSYDEIKEMVGEKSPFIIEGFQGYTSIVR